MDINEEFIGKLIWRVELIEKMELCEPQYFLDPLK